MIVESDTYYFMKIEGNKLFFRCISCSSSPPRIIDITDSTANMLFMILSSYGVICNILSRTRHETGVVMSCYENCEFEVVDKSDIEKMKRIIEEVMAKNLHEVKFDDLPKNLKDLLGSGYSEFRIFRVKSRIEFERLDDLTLKVKCYATARSEECVHGVVLVICNYLRTLDNITILKKEFGRQDDVFYEELIVRFNSKVVLDKLFHHVHPHPLTIV